MISYKDYEKSVFDWLMQKHEKNPAFTFSLRRKGSKGAELDYFIGTSASNYFGTTFWHIPIGYPGSSTDLFDLFFSYTKEQKLSYYFEIVQTRSPTGEQNTLALEFVKNLKSILKKEFSAYIESPETNKMEWCQIVGKNTNGYDTFENLVIDLEKDLEKAILIVDNALADFKSKNPDFIGHRISTQEFSDFLEKKDRRFERFGSGENLNEDFEHETIDSIDSNKGQTHKYPLNQILFGPPGTGKTFSTFDYAYKIVYNLPESEEIAENQAQKWFVKELDKEETERQVEFVTFHQNYSYEDFIKGIKPSLDDSLAFKEHEGVFYKICMRALENQIRSSQASTLVKPTFEEVFDEFLKPYTENGTNISVSMKRESYEITAVNDKNLSFLKKSGGTGHTLSIKTIRELFNNERKYNLQGLGVYYYPLIDTLKQLEGKLSKTITNVERKRYVLVIDEINRANISRVFGELITLIEDDKRWGNKYAMAITLPDGKTKFRVPNNLYIVGTMNTADKSIALLDIALRRRFEFTPLYPDVNFVIDEYRSFFTHLNKQIINRKGVDFTIGHSFFMDGKDFDFVRTMNSKVIPLLTEYFYNSRSNTELEKLLNDVLQESKMAYKVENDGFQLKILSTHD